MQLWEFESRSWRGVLDTTLYDKVCQWLAAGRWFSQGTPVAFTNKTYHHNITEMQMKVALNTIILTFWEYFWTVRYYETRTLTAICVLVSNICSPIWFSERTFDSVYHPPVLRYHEKPMAFRQIKYLLLFVLDFMR